jgi:hypothetical protein
VWQLPLDWMWNVWTSPEQEQGTSSP